MDGLRQRTPHLDSRFERIRVTLGCAASMADMTPSPTPNDASRAFARYRERGDPADLAAVFDATALGLSVLAGHLVRSASDVEDLVQQTFLVALRDAHTWDGERPVAAWLAGILRHRALELLRRRERTRSAGADELSQQAASEPSPLERSASADAAEQVVAAIERIDDPTRTVLVLRLVHGLEPREIAHALGRPPGTVRMQLMRGLEKLRSLLPQRSDLLGGALSTLLVGESARGLAAVRTAVVAQASGGAVATSGVAAASAAPAFAGSPALLVACAAVAAAVLALVVGTLPWGAGQPALAPLGAAGGAAVARVEPGGAGPAPSAPTTPGDPGPRARRALGSPTDDGAALSAPTPAPPLPSAAASQPGPTGALAGRILRPDGSPSPGPWRVSAEVHGERAEDLESPYFEYAPWDAATGAFRFEALPTGPVELRIASPDGGVLDALPTLSLTVRAGELVTRDVIDDGPFATTRLYVVTECAPGRGLGRPRREHVRLVDEDGGVHRPARDFHLFSTWLFADLPSRPLTLVIDDPDFEPLRVEGLATGRRHAFELVGASRVDVLVTGPDGRPAGAAEVELELMPPIDETTRTLSTSQSATTDGSGRVTLWTRRAPQFLHVRSAGAAPVTREFADGLPAGATALAIDLEPALTIAGRVVQPDGTPVPHAEVRCRPSSGPTPRTAQGHFVSGVVPGEGRDPSVVTHTDADGHFVLGPLAAGAHDVGVALGRQVDTAVFDVPAGTAALAIVTPPHGRLTVRLAPLPPSLAAYLDGNLAFLQPVAARVELPRRELPDEPRLWKVCYGRREATFDAAGTCVLEHVPAGRVPIAIDLPGAHLPRTNGGQGFSGPRLGPFEVEVPVGGAGELVVDLSAHALADVRVAVTSDGAPGTGLVVVGRRVDDGRSAEYAHATGLCDASGVAVLRPVYVGTYRFHVQPLDGTWQVPIDGEHSVALAGALTLSADVTPVRGRVQLVDESGAVLAGQHVAVELLGGHQWRATDAHGFVELVLVAGRHRLDLGGPVGAMPLHRGRSVELEWTASGPALALVVVPDAESR